MTSWRNSCLEELANAGVVIVLDTSIVIAVAATAIIVSSFVFVTV
ncbi:MAG: hypothetical protein WCF03_11725 [Nitrososphaeraceae archaeon]